MEMDSCFPCECVSNSYICNIHIERKEGFDYSDIDLWTDNWMRARRLYGIGNRVLYIDWLEMGWCVCLWLCSWSGQECLRLMNCLSIYAMLINAEHERYICTQSKIAQCEIYMFWNIWKVIGNYLLINHTHLRAASLPYIKIFPIEYLILHLARVSHLFTTCHTHHTSW